MCIRDSIEAGWAKPSWEEVVERDPDVILILEYTGDDVAEKREFLETNEFTKDLRAVKEGRIYSCLLYTSKRVVSVLLSTCLVAGMLAGCGSKTADTTTTTAEETKAVSYTHLDVYKRQSL